MTLVSVCAAQGAQRAGRGHVRVQGTTHVPAQLCCGVLLPGWQKVHAQGSRG